MRSAAIGGLVSYAILSQQYRPTDPLLLAAEIRRLHREQLLTPVDIAAALRIDLAQVQEILGEVRS